MDEKHDADKVDDVMLPGFRFHPTDEELVGFYLKRKVQLRQLAIELIKQVDIYKYDPWDLPKLAPTGEKEWYFYCPRDRKYRNSARPNRVTGAGFWKATGTDRPIYSSGGTKCIGLKKSLVFYRGRAAKGIKTDWMMHEFRLPSLCDPSPPKKLLDKSFPANDAWAICRIFKKTNSMAQRALSLSWVSPFPAEVPRSDVLNQEGYCPQFSSENISCTTEIGSVIPFSSNNGLQHASAATFAALDVLSHKPLHPTFYKPSLIPNSNGELPNSFMFSQSEPTKCTVDTSSMLLNQALVGDISKGCSETVDFSGPQQFNGFSISMHQNMQGTMDQGGLRKNQSESHDTNQWGTLGSPGFPFSLPSGVSNDWKLDLPWDSNSPPCISDMSTSYSTNKCYA
ncbi:hypothetical protein HS088_TW23G00089 [Tripterygium wilfordii]|uniref:NAC domain-containing protein n=1 Tax=Tripterygium wilfordii TaxID=458696 RepID=A0A7J7BTV8_TRIWF|nr:protein FEZ-like [Tripterygium wilfordii]XP_038695302.1 protein FEZ-like [Tripterygium wilfordii]KAF5725344.1 hypothetical protein HS088_TW23G00065 [Tripterygium wilfordii]KAF5725368.1 hypothetical protein HS088_TW23G00089 [Tripterygium wilfordii]